MATVEPLADDWRARLAHIDETMRAMSRETDPQEMVRVYGQRIRRLLPDQGFLSLSRRDLTAPRYRITRSTRWSEPIDPWAERDRLPLLEGGLLAELIYGDGPRLVEEIDLAPGDPAAPYLEGYRSLLAIPHYDGGEIRNMVLLLRPEPRAFPHDQIPEQVWLSGLFGRATQTLVLSRELKRAYQAVEREMQVVADIQRSLLPTTLPEIPGLDLAAHYQTSRHAGGDYYDFFPLPEGRWGLLIADVSGHGTPAAVIMAITHAIAHHYSGDPAPPGRLLEYVNDRLAARYTGDSGTFVTAFYGLYDPATRRLEYASAGHNPPRLRRCNSRRVEALDGAQSLPLGLFPEVGYAGSSAQLAPGDRLVLFTDGVIDATDVSEAMFGLDRLDASFAGCHGDAASLLAGLIDDLRAFCGDAPVLDDRTLVVARAT